jgi:predicted GIY-YIG superfamily endonuclease
MTDFHVYILQCADGSFYTGHTDNLEQRLGHHQAGTFDGYTSTRRPVLLLWNTTFASRDDAFAFERRVKNWSRAKKIALMASNWPALKRAAIPPGERNVR